MRENPQIAVQMQVSKENLETGLRGFPVGFCTTSSVEAEKGLFYVGRPVEELADREPSEVIYLLLNKTWPTAEQSQASSKLLADRQNVAPEILTALAALPRAGHPMKWFITAINALGMVA